MKPYELKEARDRLGLSAKAMAQELGISESTLYVLEAGPKPVPKPIAVAVDALIKRNNEYHDEIESAGNIYTAESHIANQNDFEVIQSLATAPIVMQRNALLGWDLLWYIPLLALILLFRLPKHLHMVWIDLTRLYEDWLTSSDSVWLALKPVGPDFFFTAIAPLWVFVIVPELFAKRSIFPWSFPYRRRCVAASFAVVVAFEYLLYLWVDLSWPPCTEVNRCFRYRAFELPPLSEFVIYFALGALGLVVLVHFAKASKNHARS
jgi:DNA-binding XRE family transcriptional regulator